MFSSLKLSQKGLILVAVPLFFECLFVGVLYKALQDAEDEVRRAEHAAAVTGATNQVIQLVVKAGQAAYLVTKGQNDEAEQDYHKKLGELNAQFALLQREFKNNKEALASVDRIRQTVDRAIMYMDESHRAARTGDLESAMDQLNQIVSLKEDLMLRMEGLVREYRSIVDDSPKRQYEFREQLRRYLIAGVIGNVLVAVALALYFNKGTAQRLELLMENTVRVARNEPLHEPLPGRDEIAHLDATFHDMANALAEAARIKRQLIAVVSHELRTPLTSVLGFLNLLVDEVYCPIPPTLKERASASEANVERLIGLINDLIDIEKMDSGHLTMNFAETDLQAVFDRSVQALREFAETHAVSITVQATTAHVYADSNRLVQVMVNLLSNAIKFSPPGKSIDVRAEPWPGMVVVHVSDRAETIPAEYASVIFERFKQIKASDETEKGGSGLGLAICKAIVEQHGGIIGVNSRDGGGNEFWFRVPTAPPEADQNVSL